MCAPGTVLITETIAEGREPFGTGMPAFKDTLSEEQVWQIILYLRAGFPAADQNGQE